MSSPRILPAVLFVGLAAHARADDGVAPLPDGVKAVWAPGRAAREATPTRDRLCINGLWRWQPAALDSGAPPAGGWGHFKVPGPWPGIGDYMQKDAQTLYPHPRWKDVKLSELRAAWYEREVTVPADWAGRRVALAVDGLNSLASVFIDGRPAGELNFPGGEVDLTPLRLAPGRHRLALHVVALPLRGVMLSYTDSASARRVKGSVARRGLCGDVYLASTPPAARVDDVRISTSVHKSEITWDAALEGLEAGSSYTLHVELLRDGRPIASFDGPAFTPADLRRGRFALTTRWRPDRLWDLHTPGNIETARLSLRDARGATLDTFWDRRFGFRELEIVGRDFVLNGSRIHLCAVPLDNAQVSAALATYDSARESLDRLKGFGVNFVYTHNYGCEPGSHLAFDEILRAADDAGVLVSFSQPHFSHYDWKPADADGTNGYARHAAHYTRIAGNHPSVVFYSMSHNATGYAEDMNPDLFGMPGDPRDDWSRNNAKLALRAEAIVRGLDPSRAVYHHASGNLGIMHDTNFYPNLVPIQELSDWFERWSVAGIKPAFTCEYGAPFTWDWTMYRGWYRGERSFGSARVPWEFCLAEWNAQFLGDRAYKIGEAEKANLRWEARQFREGKTWHRWDYPFEVGSKVFDDRHEVISRYLADNFRAFRTWGLSATSPWEHDHYWRLRPGVDRGRKALAVDWDDLQRPGYSPDFIDRTYERMDLAYRREDWEPTADGRALLRNNRPLLGYLAGKSEHFTSKDHDFRPGEVVRKQLIVLNNARTTASCQVSWSLDLPAPVRGDAHASVATGQQWRGPIEVRLPDDLAPGSYRLGATFAFGTGETQHDTFTIDVLPRPVDPPSAGAPVALFDPVGETSALLTSLGVAATPVGASADLSGFDVLVIGKRALTVDGPAPRLDRVRRGLRVIAFEQSAQALEKRLGFRVQEYGLREVFPRVPDHPLLAGIAADYLHDWRGEATLLPPRLGYEIRPMHGPTVRWCDIPVTRAWRCGNRGSVASVLIEKPARGDFLPIVDGGFGLQYSPLLEYREGRGLVVFCQLDVTARSEPDPAAEALVRNLLRYAAGATGRAPGRAVVYAGEAAGLAHLRAAGIAASPLEAGDLPRDGLLVVGPGGAATVADRKPSLAAWLGDGGALLAVGLDEAEIAALSTGPARPQTRRAEHIAASFEPPRDGSPLAGVGPADVHNRDPRVLPLIAEGAEAVGGGVLAVVPGHRVVFCQLVPWQFEDASRPNVKRTYRRASFLLSRLLADLGAAGDTPILDRFAAPIGAAEPGPRFRSGLYLDRPEEWDDPYRFFRW